MASYTDTHSHMDFERYDDDREQVLSRAWEADLVWIINPGINTITSKKAIHLAEQYPGKLYAAVGVHPNYGDDWSEDSIQVLKELAHSHSVVAVGEIGLDYYRTYTSIDLQKIMFKAQLDLAKELSLPVIIHNRDSTEDLMNILTNWHDGLLRLNHPLATRPGVLHSYSADEKTARKAVAMNFYIGVSGPVTFKNASSRRSITASIPIEHILLETDAPFLTPHPFRGRRNEPAHIPLIAAEIARLHNISPTQVADITYTNAKRLFNIDN